MPVNSLVPNRDRPLGDHLAKAAILLANQGAALRQLGRQLAGTAVVPVIGAGGSYDCGVKLGREVSEAMYEEYDKDPTYVAKPSKVSELKSDLGSVADAICLETDQKTVVASLGLDDPDRWPDAATFPDHFCAYRVLARLAREDLFSEAVSFNYDCGFEKGLRDEGFLFTSGTRGRRWRDHATVVSDANVNAELERRGAFVLTKAHGCAARYRELAAMGVGASNGSPEESIVIRWGQLLDWRTDAWARDLLADRARRHVVLLLGFSGQDAVVHIGLTRVLQEVYGGAPDPTVPRVVVIDHDPNALPLRMLVREGCGRRPPPAGTITDMSTHDSTMTAMLLALMVEMLAAELTRAVAPAPEPETRLAELAVAAPGMARWTFLLESRNARADGVQRINFERAEKEGYVPLTSDPQRTGRALRTRRRLRKELGYPSAESLSEALHEPGWVVMSRRGIAYMPVGLVLEDLFAPPLDDLRYAYGLLSHPRHLDCVVVADGGRALVGRSISTGAKVEIP